MATTRHTTARFVSLVTLAASLALVLCGAFGTLPRARAEEPPVPAAPKSEPVAPRPAEPGTAELMLGVETPVLDVLKNLAKITGSTITWSDQDKAVTSKKILSGGIIVRVDPAGLFDAVRALLANEEIVLLPYGPPAARMYQAMDARMLASQFILKAQPDPVEITDAMIPTLLGQGGRFVTATIRVKTLPDLRDARIALQRMITQNNIGSVQEVPAARAFVVTDFAPNVAAIYRAIQAMDVPPAPLPTADTTRVASAYFVLKHAKASKVAFALHQLFDELAPAPAPRATSTGAPSPGTAPYGPAGQAPASPAPRITADEDANQVIVIATAEDATTIADVVRHMDVEPAK